MFEAAELGRKVSREEYDAREPELHAGLLAAQREIRAAGTPVIIIVAGVEGAGKGDVVSRLHQWMDARGLETHTFWDETDEERERPRFWRFWRALPQKGRTSVLFGSWYTRPIIDTVLGETDSDSFDRELERIRHFEDMLTDDGALIIKLWFHLSENDQRKRIKGESKGRKSRISPLTRAFSRRYADFRKASERALRRTDVGHAPWHVIESGNRRYRDLEAGTIVLQMLNAHLARNRVPPAAPAAGTADTVSAPGVLSRVDLDRTLEDKQYRDQLATLSDEIYRLAWKAHKKKINTVAVFEGWDAAGKGGAIRRVTRAMDARLYRVISVAAPTDEEIAHHYLWRFWRQVPRAGYHTIYDRSWYGRVLVERVEGFAQEHEWQRAYNEINSFEEQLVDHGALVLKFWIHIDADEQLRRFRERENTPWKQHKITDEDWRNRDRWNDYDRAITDMVARTSTELAPWTLVSGNDKRVARVEVLQTYRDRLAAALD